MTTPAAPEWRPFLERGTAVTYVIPCSGAKLDHAAPARDLYTGSHFRNALRVAEAMAAAPETPGRVLILSAKHGLVALDTVLDPYNTRMHDQDAITVSELTATAQAAGIDYDQGEVFALLPDAYLVRLAQALAPLDVYPTDVYEASPGVGYQRGTIRHCRDAYADCL